MIQVVFCPALATVQDMGRDGYWSQGLGRAGAMDSMAHLLANLLLGNQPGDATLEIPLTPARFRFAGRQSFAIAGGQCDAHLDGIALPRVYAGVATEGSILELGSIRDGGPVYLSLPGGIDVPKVLGSRATQLREGFGGYRGRVLCAGDQIAAKGETLAFPPGGMTLPIPQPERHEDGAILLRALPSAEREDFTSESLARFWSEPYRVTAQSNRQGYRLDGPPLERQQPRELRSHGIVPGIIQVPNGGQPIIQLADSATMGGYPKIACVIDTDLWAVAQARPGHSLRFREVSLGEAAKAEHSATAFFAQLAAAQHQVMQFRGVWF